MVKYLIFDFDGTLVDSKNIVIPMFNQIAERHKFKKLEHEDIEHLRRLPVKERCKYLHVPVYRLPFLALEFYRLYKNDLKNLFLFDGMKEVLDELNQKGYCLAIISSNSEPNIREFLHRNGIDYIKEIFCSNKIFGKDQVIRKFLKTYRLANSEVIYIGDEQRDIVACKRSGVKVIWVEWGFDVIEMVRSESPDFVVSAPREILGIVSRI